eukprot:899133-Pyramimonas_sp.AAC.1
MAAPEPGPRARGRGADAERPVYFMHFGGSDQGLPILLVFLLSSSLRAPRVGEAAAPGQTEPAPGR